MKKTLFILTVLALGFTACNKETEQPKEENQEVDVYNVCIPASMGADTKAVDFSGTDPVTGKPTAVSSFTTSDIIYVYNQTKGAMLTGHLSPSAAGKTCDLTGTLIGTIEKDDNLVLLYKLNFFNSESNVYCYDYSEQNGTQAGVLDGATATVTASVDDDNLTAASASFTNVQSMFRFQFASGGTPVNVKSVLITSKNNALSIVYYPLFAADPYLLSFSVPVSLPSATTDPIYVALCMDESISAGDELTFGVVDADNKYYTKTKAAPSGGFKNGRYYYNSSAIDLGDYALQLVKPTLSRSDDGYDSELADAAADRCFYIYSPLRSGVGTADGISMSISGTSTGYSFGLSSYADDAAHAVNLSGLTATFAGVAADDNFIYSSDNLTLNISGENTIICSNSRFCVNAYNALKLSGNGTLTVTSNYAAGYGIGGSNYNPIASSNPSVLAADGHTVTRSATTDNGDGTYTWTYTVYPTPPAGALSGMFTVNGSGKQVFFSQGNLKYDGVVWSFHTHQYDWFPGSSTATGYPMDLFTWGNISPITYYGETYYTGTANLSGNWDWGSNMADGWRTLTKAEWEYLFNTRTTTSGVRFARGTVNGVTGMILLPDSWSTSYYSLTTGSKKYSSNKISSEAWASSLEAHGAVFLPAAGSRTGYGLDITAQQGSYWSSSPDESTLNAFSVDFNEYFVLPTFSGVSRQVGRSVRLVYDVE